MVLHDSLQGTQEDVAVCAHSVNIHLEFTTLLDSIGLWVLLT